MARKKIVFVIVEGPSDEEALGVILTRIYSLDSVYVHVMSCNLDHALYGKLNSTDEEKEADAFLFAERYADDIPAFLHFISASDFSITGDYSRSWQYIRENLHSLERNTNFAICFGAEDSNELV